MINKIGIVLGRGIEGCGPTKQTVETVKWCKANGIETTVVATKWDWPRKKAMLLDATIIDFNQTDSPKLAADALSDCDWVILQSVGARQHTETMHANFNEMLRLLTGKVCLIHHDHNVSPLKSNPTICPAVERANLVLTHSKSSDFANKYLWQYINPLVSFDESNNKRVEIFIVGLGFEENRRLYWKKINEQNHKRLHWLGRSTPWKGSTTAFKLHSSRLKELGFAMIMEGAERSIMFPKLFDQTQTPFTDFSRKIKLHSYNTDLSESFGADPFVFGSFENEPMLNIMSEAGYGIAIGQIKSKYITCMMENTNLEILSCGAFPVFSREMGQHNINLSTGKPQIEEDTGVLWLSKDNINEVADEIIRLNFNLREKDERRHAAYDYFKTQFDSDIVHRRLINFFETTA